MTAPLYDQFPGFFDLKFIRQQGRIAKWVSDKRVLAKLVDEKNSSPLRPNPIFDCSFYAKTSRCAEMGGVANPIVHYLQAGDLEGVHPNLFFSPDHYRRRHSIARAPHVNTVELAMLAGIANVEHPHPLVDIDHLAEQLGRPDRDVLVADLFANRLGRVDPHPLFSLDCLERCTGATFRTVGEAVRYFLEQPYDIQTHHLLDPVYYFEQLGDVTHGAKALLHYLAGDGALDPHPLFDSAYYCRRVFDLCGTVVRHPLLHYAKEGVLRGIDPSPYFNSAFYQKASCCSGEALKHYLLEGGHKHLPPHPLVDMEAYWQSKPYTPALSEVPAVDLALQMKTQEPSSISLFDPEYYRAIDPDTVNSFPSSSAAYFTKGFEEGDPPSEMFSVPYALNALDWGADSSENVIARYFQERLHERNRMLFAVPNLDATQENQNMLAIVQALSKMPEVEIILLAEQCGALEQEFRRHAHLHLLGFKASCEDVSLEEARGRVDRFLGLLGSNPPAIAFCDGAETSNVHKFLSSCGIPVVSIIGNWDGSAAGDRFTELLAGSCSVMFHSPLALAQVKSVHPDLPCDLASSCLCFSDTRHSEISMRTVVRRALGLPGDAFVVLGGGGLSLDDGLDEFATVMRRLCHAKCNTNNVYFVWTGDGFTGAHSLYFYVAQQNRLAGVDRRMILAPKELNRHSLFEASDIFLQPATPTPPFNMILEALASGTPIVISRSAGGFDELFNDEYCIAYDHCDLDAACAALSNFKEDGALFASCSAAAALNAAANWSEEAALRLVVDTINQHSHLSLQLPLQPDEPDDLCNIYVRGRSDEAQIYERIQDHLGPAQRKMICLGGRFEPEIEEVVRAPQIAGSAVYQPESNDAVSLQSAMAAAISDQRGSVSVFIDLHDVLTEEALSGCDGRKILVVSQPRENADQLYQLGMLLDELHVPDAAMIERMKSVNPLVASRMFVLGPC